MSEHEIIQPVHAFRRLRDAEQLKKRIIALHMQGWTYQQIADQLNQDQFYSPKGLEFTDNAVHMFLRSHCREELCLDRGPFREYLGPDEWLVDDLSRAVPMPQETLQYWRRRGWVQARQLRGSKRWIFWADADEVVRLKELRACPINYYPRSEPYPVGLITPKARPN